MSRWYFEPILDSYLAVILITVGLWLLLLIGPRFQSLDRRRNGTLLSLRAVLVLLIGIAMLQCQDHA